MLWLCVMEMSSSLSSSTPSAIGANCSSVPSVSKRKSGKQFKCQSQVTAARSIPVSTPGSLGASPVHVLGMLSLHLRWTLKRQSRHWRPCLKSPLRSLRQKWHTVGFVYEWTTNVCGILMRPAISFSIQKGRPALMEGRPCFWILGLVLPLDGLLDTLCKTHSRLRALRRLWESYGLTHYYAHDANCNGFITAGHGVGRAARQNIGWRWQKRRRQQRRRQRRWRPPAPSVRTVVGDFVDASFMEAQAANWKITKRRKTRKKISTRFCDFLCRDLHSHFNPWRTRPKSISPQKSQKAGDLYECTFSWCGRICTPSWGMLAVDEVI